jgi:hypothetical protein
MEVFDRSLTHILIEMHNKYLSNFHIKYISNSDQFVSSGTWRYMVLHGVMAFLPKNGPKNTLCNGRIKWPICGHVIGQPMITDCVIRRYMALHGVTWRYGVFAQKWAKKYTVQRTHKMTHLRAFHWSTLSFSNQCHKITSTTWYITCIAGRQYNFIHITKVGVLRASHKIFLSLRVKFEWRFSRSPFMYFISKPQTFHLNFTLRLKKKLVGFSHYGHFRMLFNFANDITGCQYNFIHITRILFNFANDIKSGS